MVKTDVLDDPMVKSGVMPNINVKSNNYIG